MTVSDEVVQRVAKGWTVPNADLIEMATELLQRRNADRWIPVEERLPELPNWVIAYNPIPNSGDPCPAFYRDGKWYFELGEEWDMNMPTHWRPLPAPPEAE